MTERISTDVLIIGAGGAGLRAAIAACESAPGLAVLLLTKGRLGESGVTATACSDRMAFHATLPTTEPVGADAWRYHAEDIYRVGGYVSDADLAAVLARESAGAFSYLEQLGVPFVRRAAGGSGGTVDQFVTDGSLYARACYTGPYTANHIEQALLRRARALPLRVLESHLAAELLLTEDGRRVAGALAVDQVTGRPVEIWARAVVLATGGAGQLYKQNVFPPEMTGDGYALAYRAGAALVNMEFIQIGLCSPATRLACSGSMMRALPRLVDETGAEVLPSYLPGEPARRHELLFAKGATWPLSAEAPSHAIDLAVFRHRAAGHRVYLDYTADPMGLEPQRLAPSVQQWFGEGKGLNAATLAAGPLARLRAINPPVVAWLRERGLDLEAGARVEVVNAAQHFQGGVKIRTRGETTLAGLYAAGEAAGGQHGANRPGGNALLDGQVFGRLAGEAAAAEARALPAAPEPDPRQRARLEQELAELNRQGLPARQIRASLQGLMDRAASAMRCLTPLGEALRQVAAWRQEGICVDERGMAYALETRNLLTVAEMVLGAALRRDESRGPHLRFRSWEEPEPLPRRDPDWQRYIVIRKGPAGEMQFQREEPVRTI